jgi:hypothetical protein
VGVEAAAAAAAAADDEDDDDDGDDDDDVRRRRSLFRAMQTAPCNPRERNQIKYESIDDPPIM